MSAMTDVLALLATDEQFARRFRADPSPTAREFGLSEDEVAQLLALRSDEGDGGPEHLGQRLSKSSIGAAGVSSLFHAGAAAPASGDVQVLGSDDGHGGDQLYLHADSPHTETAIEADDSAPAAGDVVTHGTDATGHPVTITTHADGSRTEHDWLGEDLDYDAAGHLVEVSGPQGDAIPWAIDADAHFDTVYHPDGTSDTMLTYTDASGQLHAVTDSPPGHWTDTVTGADGTRTVTHYEQGSDAVVRPTDQTVTFPDGSQASVSYDAAGHVSAVSGTGTGGGSWTDQTGHHTLVHGADGTVTLQTATADGTRTDITLDSSGHETGETQYSASGAQTGQVTFNADGTETGTGVIHGTDLQGHPTTTTYHADGTRTVHDWLSQDSTYDSAGHLLEQSGPIGDTVPWALDADAHFDTIYHADGTVDSTTTYTDANGQEHSVVDDPPGHWTDTVTGADGTRTVTHYEQGSDAVVRPTDQTVTFPDGSQASVSYDAAGHVSAVSGTGTGGGSWTDQTGHHTLVHGADGTVTLQTATADGTRTDITLDSSGHETGETQYSASGAQTGQVTFNADGTETGTGVIHGTDLQGHPTTTTYHADGTRTVHDWLSQDSTYDSAGHLLEQSGPQGDVIPWARDASAYYDTTYHADGTADTTLTYTDADGHDHVVTDSPPGHWTDTVTGSDGTQTVTHYDQGSDAVVRPTDQTVTHPDGSTDTTTYDSSGDATGTAHTGPTVATPTDPTPTDPTATGTTDPTSTDPTPTGMTDPTPTDPTSTDPTPTGMTDPTPTDPTPPDPTATGMTDPTPPDPTPTDPTPSDTLQGTVVQAHPGVDIPPSSDHTDTGTDTSSSGVAPGSGGPRVPHVLANATSLLDNPALRTPVPHPGPVPEITPEMAHAAAAPPPPTGHEAGPQSNTEAQQTDDAKPLSPDDSKTPPDKPAPSKDGA